MGEGFDDPQGREAKVSVAPHCTRTLKIPINPPENQWFESREIQGLGGNTTGTQKKILQTKKKMHELQGHANHIHITHVSPISYKSKKFRANILVFRRNPENSSQSKKNDNQRNSEINEKIESRLAALSRSISPISLCMVQARLPLQ